MANRSPGRRHRTAGGVESRHTRPSAELDSRKRETEARLRERHRGFTRADFLSLPVMATYAQYYKRFDKTYHVLLQVESIVFEVETLVLTAGHDVDKLVAPVSIDVSRDGDRLTQMGGTPKAIPPGDVVMRDAKGVCCSILYGQDNCSPISVETSHVLYVACALPGVPPAMVEAHLRAVEAHLRLVSPRAVIEQRQLLSA